MFAYLFLTSFLLFSEYLALAFLPLTSLKNGYTIYHHYWHWFSHGLFCCFGEQRNLCQEIFLLAHVSYGCIVWTFPSHYAINRLHAGRQFCQTNDEFRPLAGLCSSVAYWWKNAIRRPPTRGSGLQ